MAQVALIDHAKPKTRRTKARISKALSDHARREFVVVAIELARPAERGMRRSDDSAPTKYDQGPENSATSAGVEAQCGFHPCWPTPPTSEPLAGAGRTGWHFGGIAIFAFGFLIGHIGRSGLCMEDWQKSPASLRGWLVAPLAPD